MLVSKTINSKEYRILMIGLHQSGYTPDARDRVIFREMWIHKSSTDKKGRRNKKKKDTSFWFPPTILVQALVTSIRDKHNSFLTGLPTFFPSQPTYTILSDSSSKNTALPHNPFVKKCHRFSLTFRETFSLTIECFNILF